MSDDVKLTFTGNSADAEKAIAQLERKYDALEQKIKRLKTATKPEPSFIDGLSAGADKAAMSITGISGPLDVLRMGINQIGAEWDAVIQRQERARQSSMDYAQTLEQLYINAVGDESFPDLATADKTVRQLSQKTGVEPKDIANALNVAIAAKGNLAPGTDIAMVDKVLSMIPLSTSSHDGAVAGGLGLQKALPGTTPEQALGFLLRSAGTSAVASNEKFVKNAVPAILGGVVSDPSRDARGASAIYNTLGQVSGDVEGRRTRTAAISMELQLQKFLEDEKQLVSHMDRVRFMQQTPEAMRAFMDGGEFKGRKRGHDMVVTGPDGEEYSVGGKKASFERQMEPFVRELLTGGSNAAKMLEDLYEKTPEVAQSGQFYDKAVADLKQNPNIRVAESEKKLDSFNRNLQLNNIEDATADVIYKGMQRGIEDAGGSSVSTWKSFVRFTGRRMLGQSPQEAATNTLQDTIQDNRRNIAFGPQQQSVEDAFNTRMQSLIDRINTLNAPAGNAAAPDPNQAKAVQVLERMDAKLDRIANHGERGSVTPSRTPAAERN